MLTDENDEEDVQEFELKHRVFYEEFMHFEDFKSKIDSLKDVIKYPSQTESLHDQFILMFNFYQEQPYLMDAYLRKMIDHCFESVKDNFDNKPIVHFIYKIVFQIIKTRGHKYVIKLMPHSVTDLLPTIEFLESLEFEDFRIWPTKFVLLLWLSIIVMIPFDFDTIEMNREGKMVERILTLGKKYLEMDDKAQIASSLLLSHTLLRPDVQERYLEELISFSIESIKSKMQKKVYGKCIGYFRFLCNICQSLPRNCLMKHLPKMLTLKEVVEEGKPNDIHVMKFISKLTQRIGMLYCPNKATWIYKKVHRSLGTSLLATDAKKESLNYDFGVNENIDTPEEVAEIIDFLISLLESSYTVVRWSAAKGIARICSSLSSSMVSDVIEAVLQLCNPESVYSNWHGSCLTLAEMGRRGLLLPDKLAEVIPIVKKALFYEEKIGQYNFGTNVRDASCYVIWSFARAYSPDDFRPFVDDIANNLVLSMLYDKQVNVRRASASALQEHVGRQGTFSNGIEIITTCDFYAVGNLTSCYTDLTEFIAKYPKYLPSLIEHLTSKICIGHWDFKIRELSSKAIKILTKFDPAKLKNQVLQEMIDAIKTGDLNMKHGAVLAVKSIISTFDTSDEIVAKGNLYELIKTLHSYLKSENHLRGEDMKMAMCEFIGTCSEMGLPIKRDAPALIDEWLDFLHESIRDISANITNSAVVAYPKFLKEFICNSDGSLDKILFDKTVANIRTSLSSMNHQSYRIGYLMTAGDVSQVLIKHDNTLADVFLDDILGAFKITKSTESWDDSRKAAVHGLTDFLMKNDKSLGDEQVEKGLLIYPQAMNDYSRDTRGDIGRNVREAGMKSFEIAVTHFVDSGRFGIFQPDLMKETFHLLIQNCFENKDQTRIRGCLTILRFVHHKPAMTFIPSYTELVEIFKDASLLERFSSPNVKSFRYFIRLLDVAEYRNHVIIGLAVTIGGLGVEAPTDARETLSKHISAQDEAEKGYFVGLTKSLIQVFAMIEKNIRICEPFLKFLHFVLSDPSYSSAMPDETDLLTELFDYIIKETTNSNRIAMIRTSVELMTTLMLYTKDEFWKKPASRLMILLGHRFPMIRRYAATLLFELLMIEEFDLAEGKIDELNTILGDTVWEDDVLKIRPIRNRICEIFSLSMPKPIEKKM